LKIALSKTYGVLRRQHVAPLALTAGSPVMPIFRAEAPLMSAPRLRRHMAAPDDAEQCPNSAFASKQKFYDY
jgi:hypothetical protein